MRYLGNRCCSGSVPAVIHGSDKARPDAIGDNYRVYRHHRRWFSDLDMKYCAVQQTESSHELEAVPRAFLRLKSSPLSLTWPEWLTDFCEL